MPRFKPYSYEQMLMIPVDLKIQLQPGTFEFALNQIVDEMDMSVFDSRFRNFDTALGRFLYSRRLGIAEPVFANICHARGLNRVTLRGRVKVDIQWKLYTMVHNILKVLRYSPRYA